MPFCSIMIVPQRGLTKGGKEKNWLSSNLTTCCNTCSVNTNSAQNTATHLWHMTKCIKHMAHEQSEQDLHGVDTCTICFTIHLVPRVGPRVGQPSHPSWGGSRLGAEFDILRHRRWSWLTMDEQVMWPSLWPSFVFVSKIKDEFVGV